MESTTFLKWNQLHSDPNFRKGLQDSIFDSWEKSYRLGIDASNSKPLFTSDKEFIDLKEKSKSLYYYANDAITTNYKNFGEDNFGLALFDNNGCVLKLYGNREFLE